MLSVAALSATITLKAQTVTNKAALDRAATLLRQYENNQYARAMALAARNHWPLTIRGKHGKLAMLSGIDQFGMPIYKVTFNLESAQTTRTNSLWPGGSTGLSLSGNSANMKGKLAIWDGGAVLATHVELANRVIQKDGATDVIDHATHTSGTLIATGINPQAKGMAYQAQELDAYDWNSDLTEMATAAPNLYLSNASYGIIAGWNFNTDNNHWEWWGTSGDTTDYKFGWYSNDVQVRDSIMYNAPYYLLSQAAGNSRGETGPAIDSPYYQVNASGNENATAITRTAAAKISSNAYFNTIPPYGTTKNGIVVGAIEPIPSGYSAPSDVQMTYFSGWGPTGDGRIKPDIVADGDNVLSTISTSNYAYEEESGTSMSTPNVTGSLYLLQEYYTKIHHDSAMLASTLKALAIHTADEAGANPGPDYEFGWGLLDMRAAAAAITASNTDQSQLILEKVMTNSGANDTISIPVVASGKGPLVATIAWTDPAGPLNTSSNQHNYPVELVNDLDVRVIKGTSIYGSTVYQPWVLNPTHPTNAATRGDDALNNVEKVEADTVSPGGNYIIRITHKGTLARGQQAVSVIIGGVGGTAYCASAPTSSAGTTIDSVTVNGVKEYTNYTSCTTYTDNTGIRVGVTGGQTVPLVVSLGACDNTSTSRMVKVYIDYNGNGSFADPGEEVASSGVLGAPSAALNATFTVPSNVTVGNTTRMRIVAVETTDSTTFGPCTTYTKGETQDYSVYFNQPSVDLSLTSLADPLSPVCADSTQIVTVNIRNTGTTTQSKIPVTATVMNGATTVATLTGTYPDAIAGGGSVVYTLPGTFNAQAGSTYTINASVNLSGDQNTANNTASFTISVNPAPASASSGTAVICSGGSTATLTVNNPDSSSSYFWYTTPTGGSPVAQGYNTTASASANTTFYFSSGFSGGAGPASRASLDTAGGYNAFYGNWVSYHAAVPVTLESARFYTKYHGNIAFIVADVDQSSINSSTGSFSYLPYSTTTLYVNATSPHPEKPHSDGSTQTSDPADTGAVFFLNMQLPAGNHDIIIESLDSATIYRNAGITANPYPIGSTNLFAWTGNSAGVTSTSLGTTYQGYYYFFYDAKIKTADCASSSARTQVNTTTSSTAAPTITEVGDSLISSAATGNQWYLNGLAIAGANNTVYKPAKSGTYYTIVSGLTGACTNQSNSINFVLTAVDTAAAPKGLLVTPNPTTGILNVSFTVTNIADLTFEVYNILGQLLYKQAYPSYIGSYSGQLNLSGYADGVYILKITHGDNTTIEKILVQH